MVAIQSSWLQGFESKMVASSVKRIGTVALSAYLLGAAEAVGDPLYCPVRDFALICLGASEVEQDRISSYQPRLSVKERFAVSRLESPRTVVLRCSFPSPQFSFSTRAMYMTCGSQLTLIEAVVPEEAMTERTDHNGVTTQRWQYEIDDWRILITARSTPRSTYLSALRIQLRNDE